MTAEEWRKTYYPVPAAECLRGDALEHSILKWTGLLAKNLPLSGPPIRVGSETCALCHSYIDATGYLNCNKCPIVQVTGAECEREYGIWASDKDAQPMLDLLLRTKRGI